MTLRVRRMLVAVLALFSLAPTPGDIGGCGQAPDLLDPPTFFANKKSTDCRRCEDCGLVSATCSSACDPDTDFEREFPPNCLPLVHDGEVCLRALQHASCSAYEAYVSDESPAVPTECNFCPAQGDP